jgi:radical SAM superfamily enzyme YgiQ (UPF0313 family)
LRALLVNPKFVDSYWSGEYALPLTGRQCLLPPLGLITVAALLPRHWACRLVDLNVESLTDEQIRWADVALVTGMLGQRTSLHQVLGRCRDLGVRTVVGGPYSMAFPREMDQADHLVFGEGEEVVPVLAADLEAGRAGHHYREPGKPDLTAGPVPRFDLLRAGSYHHMPLQYSRGCPYDCEFCDITAMYGRRPRTKTARQVIAELEAIRDTGFSGDVFFVDDNFIGNKKEVRGVLPEIAAWRRRTRAPLEFYTQVSINLADDERLADQMTRAGFTAVFVGLETPSSASLRDAGKLQNMKRDMVTQVHRLLNRGLDVWGGFILGFDQDRSDIFDRMIRFVQRAAIPYAMVGILGALPQTRLYQRLKREGRLRDDQPENQFGLTNVVTRMPTAQLLAGYRRVLETLYHPDSYFQRCRESLARWKPVRGSQRPLNRRDLLAGARALWTQGVTGPYRRAYWGFLRWVLTHHPTKLGRALAQAASGHHYITYTREVVLPSLR